MNDDPHLLHPISTEVENGLIETLEGSVESSIHSPLAAGPGKGDFDSLESRVQIHKTWLSRKPNSLSVLVASLSTFFIMIASLIYWNNFYRSVSWMTASFEKVFSNHEYWRLWTSLLVHADEKHLISNSFLFFILGALLSGYFEILFFPIFAFFMGGIINFIVLHTMNPQVELIGASGMVFWMGGAWLTLYLLIDRRLRLFQRSLRAFGVALAIFMPTETFDPHVSYQSHFYGFFLGIICGILYFQLKKTTFRAAEVTEIIFDEPQSDESR